MVERIHLGKSGISLRSKSGISLHMIERIENSDKMRVIDRTERYQSASRVMKRKLLLELALGKELLWELAFDFNICRIFFENQLFDVLEKDLLEDGNLSNLYYLLQDNDFFAEMMIGRADYESKFHSS